MSATHIPDPPITAPKAPARPSAPPNQSRRRPTVGVVRATAADVTAALGQVEAEARRAARSIQQMLPTGRRKGRGVSGQRPSTGPFILSMAAAQERFGAQLGPLSTDPKHLREMVAVSATAHQAITAVTTLARALKSLADLCMLQGAGDARLIYRQAKALSATNPVLAEHIAPAVEDFSRISQKAGATRRQKRGAASPSNEERS